MQQRRHEQSLAWATANLVHSDPKKMPSLAKFLGPDPASKKPRKRLTPEQQQARMKSWAKGFGQPAKPAEPEGS